MNTALTEYNMLQTLKNDILYTEKSIRDYAAEHGISYNKSLLIANKSGSLSESYLLYKYYMADELFSGVELSHNKQILLTCLEPFFLYITSRNGVFSKTLISSWNNSKLEDFKFCPVFFRDRYLTKEIDFPTLMSNEASSTGTTVHNAFEELINKYNKSKNKDLQKSYERFLQSKTFTFLEENHPEHVPGFKEFFTTTLPKLLKPDTIILTEQLMKMQYGEYTLYGTADLILVNGSEAILLDYKTSKIDQEFWLKENNKKYGKQLSLYAAFIKNVIPGVTSVEDAYIVYTRGLIHKLESLSDTILDDTITRIIGIKQHIKLKSFIPNTKSCLLCRHPTCENRAKESMWNTDGTRKIK
ncbi:MAG: PD-(D/E)XK nuclease family protein [Ignisphaera sp.]|nr:PD-(D/E)XK nuclease family protein [Ignisphaera sp.]